MKEKSTYRCAVYTRKSHEEGLDQDFNSLDAQAESCKAYIASQAGLGWKLRDTRYDDGGISGDHMDRPALQSLISDIKAELIDVIVVYKVDRLTRSLTDFAKLVDVFDAHDVSFVSVTQAFNTTTSMGRLTLNVLLSFAQFEREVTAERIRDKIAASKAKGMWMGGTCPLGYRNEDRKLHIVEDEAATIRTLFELYIRYQNVRLVKVQAEKLGLVSRLRTHRSGKQTGGKTFSRGHIYRILTNPIYIGQIQHKDKIYDGEHKPIVRPDIWDEVQSILKSNAAKRTTIGNSKSNALLAGLLFDSDGHKLVPHHAKTRGVRYQYYVSQKLKTSDQDSGWRIPAQMIEVIVKDILLETLRSKSDIIKLLPTENASAEKLQDITSKASELGSELDNTEHNVLKSLYNNLIETITLHSDCVSITFKTSYIKERLKVELFESEIITITKAMTIRRRGQEMKMVIDGQKQKAAKPDAALVKLVAKAHALSSSLQDGTVNSIKEFAEAHSIDHADAKRMLPLAYLAPDIVEDIIAGTQPSYLSALTLKNGYALPTLWSEQRAYLGFASI